MNQLSKKKSIIWAFGMFVVVILALIFIGTPLQMNFGMVGLLLTELVFLVLAVGGVLLTKGSFKEVFPFKMPTIRQTIGTVILWMGTYLVGIFSTIVIAYFFPASYSQTATGISQLMASIPFWARFLIIAVSPAICEEAVHRGFILHHLKPLGKKWLIVLIMGILFGAFHLDPPRFLVTGILGAIITYVALETGNMFYAFLIHFINNTLSVLSTKLTEGVEITEETFEMAMSLSTVGLYMILICITPWLLWLGATLIHPKKEKVAGQKTGAGKKALLCTVVSLVCLVGGVVLSVAGMAANMVFTDTRTVALTELAQTPYSYDFEVEESGNYMLTAVISTPEEILEVVITNEAGEVIHEFTASQLTGNFPLDMVAGGYHMEVSCINHEGEFSVKPESMGTFSFILQKL